MPKLIVISIAAVLITLVSCKETDYSSYVYSSIVDNVPNYECYDSIFIVPRTGCNSCKDLADMIVKEKYKNKNNLVIFTDIQSKKLLYIELGKEMFVQENVIIDEKKQFWQQRFKEASYPILVIREPNSSYQIHYMLDKLSPFN